MDIFSSISLTFSSHPILFSLSFSLSPPPFHPISLSLSLSLSLSVALLHEQQQQQHLVAPAPSGPSEAEQALQEALYTAQQERDALSLQYQAQVRHTQTHTRQSRHYKRPSTLGEKSA